MDSDESGHSENEFCYPEEETLNQMTPIISFPTLKRRNLKKVNMLFTRLVRSVMMGKKLCPWSRVQDLGHSFSPY